MRDIRPLLQKDEVPQLFQLLATQKVENNTNWKGRFKENSEKMRSGNIYDVASVLKNLCELSRNKELSYRERTMMEKAMNLIATELAHTQRSTPELMKEELCGVLEKP